MGSKLNKNTIYLVLILSSFFYLAFFISNIPVDSYIAPAPDTSTFTGTYLSEHYGIFIIVYDSDPDDFYYLSQSYDFGVPRAFKGKISKISTDHYTLSSEYGDREITFNDKGFIFEKGGLNFIKQFSGGYKTKSELDSLCEEYKSQQVS